MNQSFSFAQRNLLILLAFVASLAAIWPATSNAANLSVDLVTRQSTLVGGDPANDYSATQAQSRTGRFIGFSSMATNLPGNGAYQGYLRDMLLGRTVMVGRADGVFGAAADGEVYVGGVSNDGRFVSFTSRATNLDPAAVTTDAQQNVYVRDLLLHRTTLVSRQSRSDGYAGANAESYGDAISSDGRFVSFHSAATNLSDDAANALDEFGAPIVSTYRHDLLLDKTILVSRQSESAGGAGSDQSSGLSPTSISASGRYVAFDSTADNLSGPAYGASHLYLRDVHQKKTLLIDRQSASLGGDRGADGSVTSFALSSDGQHVTFSTNSTNLISTPTSSLSAFVRDVAAEETELVSRQSDVDGGAEADQFSHASSISGDGRFSVFFSSATNLHPGTSPESGHVYVHDRVLGRTTLVSRQSVADGGAVGDGLSVNGFISDDAKYVAFNTFASNLNASDIDSETAIKVLRARVLLP